MNETEDCEYPSIFFNQYIQSKLDAERAVLAANDRNGLMTCALRPAHIYGPGDTMISTVVDMRRAGSVPVRLSCGVNDYIFVENCAEAHVRCWQAMGQGNAGIPGQAFFLSDFHAKMWDHMRPFLAEANLTVPRVEIPARVMERLAWMVEVFAYFAWTWFQVPVRVFAFARYTIRAVSTDYYFSAAKAERVFGFTPRVSREEAVARTRTWVRQHALTVGSSTTTATRSGNATMARAGAATVSVRMAHSPVHAVHLCYGLLLAVLGSLHFMDPEYVAELFGVPARTFPHGEAILSQTAGLIEIVLGLYSIVASLGAWPMAYFRLTLPPKLVTATTFALLIWCQRLPGHFGVLVALEVLVACLTSLALELHHRGDGPVAYEFRFDRVTAAQWSHAIASGIFNMALTFSPGAVLPVMVPDLVVEEGGSLSASILAWGHVMGAWEFMMTWTYLLSGIIVDLDPFVRLSVYTRLGASLGLFLAAATGVATFTQAWGASADAVLAFATIAALATRGRPRN